MKRFCDWLLVVGVCLLASLALAAETSPISGPDKAEAGELVVLEAGVQATGGYAWQAAHDGKNWTTFDNGAKLVFATGKSGTYQFFMSPAAAKPAIYKKTIVIGVPSPNPPQPPVPNPPNPTPGAKLFVMLVYESDSREPAIHKLANSLSLQAALEAKGHVWAPLDKDRVDPKDAARFADWVALVANRKKPLPCLIIEPASGGEPVYFDKAPLVETEFLALITKYGG